MKSLRLWFTLSLLLNLFLVGIIAGRWLPWRGFWHPDRQWISSLPAEKQDALRRITADLWQENRPGFQRMRSAMHELRTLIAAPDFDAAAYRAKLGEMRDARLVISDAAIDRMVQLLQSMSPEERAELAEHMRKPRRFPAMMGEGPWQMRGGPLPPP